MGRHAAGPYQRHAAQGERTMERRNDAEREQWVNNDEGLYNWQRTNRDGPGGKRLGMRAFIRANRAELDAAIDRALAPRGSK